MNSESVQILVERNPDTIRTLSMGRVSGHILLPPVPLFDHELSVNLRNKRACTRTNRGNDRKFKIDIPGYVNYSTSSQEQTEAVGDSHSSCGKELKTAH